MITFFIFRKKISFKKDPEDFFNVIFGSFALVLIVPLSIAMFNEIGSHSELLDDGVTVEVIYAKNSNTSTVRYTNGGIASQNEYRFYNYIVNGKKYSFSLDEADYDPSKTKVTYLAKDPSVHTIGTSSENNESTASSSAWQSFVVILIVLGTAGFALVDVYD